MSVSPLPPLLADVEARLRAREKSHVVHSGTKSAVLIPIDLRGDEPRLWLLRKRDDLRKHGGQVALPGGKHEPSDGSLLETALREAEEEIGLARRDVTIVGETGAFPTITGFLVTPFVAWVHGDFSPVADPSEVARVFSVPLAVLGSPAVVREVTVPGWRGEVPCHEVDGEIIWGATFAILQDFARRALR